MGERNTQIFSNILRYLPEIKLLNDYRPLSKIFALGVKNLEVREFYLFGLTEETPDGHFHSAEGIEIQITHNRSTEKSVIFLDHTFEVLTVSHPLRDLGWEDHCVEMRYARQPDSQYLKVGSTDIKQCSVISANKRSNVLSKSDDSMQTIAFYER